VRTTPDIAVVGGGLLGRCLAWRAARAGARVVLYDASTPSGEASAAWAAAGMIAPTAEGAEVDPQIVQMGRHSLGLWPLWLAELPLPVFYRDTGTLVIWHRGDAGEAVRFERTLALQQVCKDMPRVSRLQLGELEPALSPAFREGLYLAGDAQVDNRALLKAVAKALQEIGAECHWQTAVEDEVLPPAEVVVDCRGMGARRDWSGLRGVRGEIARVHAPEIELRHMVRLLHPRSGVYVVPRADGQLVVGATSIESADYSPISVRGVLELLSSAYSVLPGLAEARILEFDTQVRPALPDNLPAFHFDHTRKILRINGLYRHGFLLTPAIVEQALALLPGKHKAKSIPQWPCLQKTDSGTRGEGSLCLSS
jgi:glycine oxidase